jgi:hypothetical protein
MENPFENQLPININEFPSRKRIIRIIEHSVSARNGLLIFSEPRTGLTSLIKTIISDVQNASADNVIMGYVNCMRLSKPFAVDEFLALLMDSIYEGYSDFQKPTEEIEARKGFRYLSSELASIGDRFQKDGKRVVIVLHEFDHLGKILGDDLFHFACTLRALSNDSSFTFLITSYALYGDPPEDVSFFYNILGTHTLPNLQPRETGSILSLKDLPFSNKDRSYIVSLAGNQPFLLKSVCKIMWDENTRKNDADSKYLKVGTELYQQTKFHFDELWKIWSIKQQKIITTIALVQTPTIIKNHQFFIPEFVKQFQGFSHGLYKLEDIGTIVKDEESPVGYKLAQGAMVSWLADKLLQTITDEQVFNDWFLEKELVGGVIKKKEVEYFNSFMKYAGYFLKEGSLSVIKAYAEGVLK